MLKIKDKQDLERVLIDYNKNKIKMKDFELIGKHKEAKEYKILIARIDNAISSLDEKEREIIELRYTIGRGKQSWKLISECLFLSRARCNTIKNDALSKLEKILCIQKVDKE
ncbi:sigma factor-like helix-turn-helix DNA-binding protein [Clostridium perfringens]|uniref:sigma factor-like helix-turn-helix DNA-binding protein n=1 Tax=Clostridium perfringens TaxID=1502 RepID=UPI000D71C832|nr:sigma factor-like helix-turn-helix DNA-binding protein [Clostridium perfringens]DAL54594.1 MAG TPA_asm: RNA polymerase sigma factor [Caudoviricetes sp.]MBO3322024.1 sigma-70 family RNA polymerase sigma factor [Clostridium perfringens]MBO3331033.1 sigma-70 family RNA polymerase sigma factor [Clostridium perfringens]MDK0903142.1 sigma factor-like helix-turn-helix DNA-binding protein [Clostridium perfringens]PWX04547.1 siderophore-interacting protein [Clostridium perfringens]